MSYVRAPMNFVDLAHSNRGIGMENLHNIQHIQEQKQEAGIMHTNGMMGPNSRYLPVSKFPTGAQPVATPMVPFSVAPLSMSSLTIPVSSSALRKPLSAPIQLQPPVTKSLSSSRSPSRERSPPVVASVLSTTPPLGPQTAPSRDPQVIMAEVLPTPPTYKRKLTPSPTEKTQVTAEDTQAKKKRALPPASEGVDALMQLALFGSMAESDTDGETTTALPKASPERKRKHTSSSSSSHPSPPASVVAAVASKATSAVVASIIPSQQNAPLVATSVSQAHHQAQQQDTKRLKLAKAASTGTPQSAIVTKTQSSVPVKPPMSAGVTSMHPSTKLEPPNQQQSSMMYAQPHTMPSTYQAMQPFQYDPNFDRNFGLNPYSSPYGPFGGHTPADAPYPPPHHMRLMQPPPLMNGSAGMMQSGATGAMPPIGMNGHIMQSPQGFYQSTIASGMPQSGYPVGPMDPQQMQYRAPPPPAALAQPPPPPVRQLGSQIPMALPPPESVPQPTLSTSLSMDKRSTRHVDIAYYIFAHSRQRAMQQAAAAATNAAATTADANQMPKLEPASGVAANTQPPSSQALQNNVSSSPALISSIPSSMPPVSIDSLSTGVTSSTSLGTMVGAGSVSALANHITPTLMHQQPPSSVAPPMQFQSAMQPHQHMQQATYHPQLQQYQMHPPQPQQPSQNSYLMQPDRSLKDRQDWMRMQQAGTGSDQYGVYPTMMQSAPYSSTGQYPSMQMQQNGGGMMSYPSMMHNGYPPMSNGWSNPSPNGLPNGMHAGMTSSMMDYSLASHMTMPSMSQMPMGPMSSSQASAVPLPSIPPMRSPPIQATTASMMMSSPMTLSLQADAHMPTRSPAMSALSSPILPPTIPVAQA